MVTSLHLKVVKYCIRQKLIPPDKSIIWAGVLIDFSTDLWPICTPNFSSVIPIPSQGINSGYALAGQGGPGISWRNRIVAVQQKGSFIQLPILRPAGNIPQVDEINMCSAKQMSRWFWRRKMERVFVGFIQAAPGKQKIQENL